MAIKDFAWRLYAPSEGLKRRYGWEGADAEPFSDDDCPPLNSERGQISELYIKTVRIGHIPLCSIRAVWLEASVWICCCDSEDFSLVLSGLSTIHAISKLKKTKVRNLFFVAMQGKASFIKLMKVSANSKDDRSIEVEFRQGLN